MSFENTYNTFPEEDEVNTVILNDPDGNEIVYELLDVIDYGMERYAVLIPLDESVEDVTIMHIEELIGENAEELRPVFDDKVLDEVFRLFMDKNKERFDFV